MDGYAIGQPGSPPRASKRNGIGQRGRRGRPKRDKRHTHRHNRHWKSDLHHYAGSGQLPVLAESGLRFLPAAGGQATVNVTTADGCPWGVVPNGVAIVSGGGGTGSGSVVFSPPANNSFKAISFNPVVAGTTVPVTVAENCTYSLSPLTVDGGQTNIALAVTPNSSACQWSASAQSAWLSTSGIPSAGTGSGSIYYSAQPNKTAASRTANIVVGSQTFVLTQTVDTLPQYTVTVNVQPSGAGTAPSVTVDQGTNVCLQETPNPGWQFSGWSGALQGTYSCLTVNSDVSVTANFQRGLQFVPITPCRAVDTRNPAGPLGGPSITGGTSRDFAIAGNACGIPANAQALSLNAAIVPTSHGYMTLWPTGQPQPGTASVNSPDGGVHSNGAIVPVGAGGAISAYAFDTMDVVLDVNGYFVPASGNPSALAFLSADALPRGGHAQRQRQPGRTVPERRKHARVSRCSRQPVACNISSAAQAYSLNIAVVPRTGAFHYLTAWPAGQASPGGLAERSAEH